MKAQYLLSVVFLASAGCSRIQFDPCVIGADQLEVVSFCTEEDLAAAPQTRLGETPLSLLEVVPLGSDELTHFLQGVKRIEEYESVYTLLGSDAEFLDLRRPPLLSWNIEAGVTLWCHPQVLASFIPHGRLAFGGSVFFNSQGKQAILVMTWNAGAREWDRYLEPLEAPLPIPEDRDRLQSLIATR